MKLAKATSSRLTISVEPYSSSPSPSQSQPLKKVATSAYSSQVVGMARSRPYSALNLAWLSASSNGGRMYLK